MSNGNEGDGAMSDPPTYTDDEKTPLRVLYRLIADPYPLAFKTDTGSGETVLIAHERASIIDPVPDWLLGSLTVAHWRSLGNGGLGMTSERIDRPCRPNDCDRFVHNWQKRGHIVATAAPAASPWDFHRMAYRISDRGDGFRIEGYRLTYKGKGRLEYDPRDGSAPREIDGPAPSFHTAGDRIMLVETYLDVVADKGPLKICSVRLDPDADRQSGIRYYTIPPDKFEAVEGLLEGTKTKLRPRAQRTIRTADIGSDRTYSPAELGSMMGIGQTARSEWTKKAGVPVGGRGEKLRLTAAEVARVLRHCIKEGNVSAVRARCEIALKSL